MNVSQCFIKLLYTDSSRPIPTLHRSQHENYENTFWILGTEWTHQKKCWELCLRLSGMSARRPCVCLHFIDQNCGRKTFRKTLRALANNRETEALASVTFFVFVVYSQHKHPKYLGRKIKPWTLPFISIFSWTLTCLSHNKYFSGYCPDINHSNSQPTLGIFKNEDSSSVCRLYCPTLPVSNFRLSSPGRIDLIFSINFIILID